MLLFNNLLLHQPVEWGVKSCGQELRYKRIWEPFSVTLRVKLMVLSGKSMSLTKWMGTFLKF